MSFNSKQYWKNRYKKGGDSGAGSGGRLAAFKAEVINAFVKQHDIQSVVELGVGDGRQLNLADYPAYIGLDISKEAINQCESMFGDDSTKQFAQLTKLNKLLHFNDWVCELSLSLDVIYHLVEDAVFEQYMTDLFKLANRFVIIYSSNKDSETSMAHVKDRQFSDWIATNAQDWTELEVINNPYPWRNADDDPNECSRADFYIYQKSV